MNSWTVLATLWPTSLGPEDSWRCSCWSPYVGTRNLRLLLLELKSPRWDLKTPGAVAAGLPSQATRNLRLLLLELKSPRWDLKTPGAVAAGLPT